MSEAIVWERKWPDKCDWTACKDTCDVVHWMIGHLRHGRWWKHNTCGNMESYNHLLCFVCGLAWEKAAVWMNNSSKANRSRRHNPVGMRNVCRVNNRFILGHGSSVYNCVFRDKRLSCKNYFTGGHGSCVKQNKAHGSASRAGKILIPSLYSKRTCSANKILRLFCDFQPFLKLQQTTCWFFFFDNQADISCECHSHEMSAWLSPKNRGKIKCRRLQFCSAQKRLEIAQQSSFKLKQRRWN